MQEKVVGKLEKVATSVEEVVKEDIWGNIERFLDYGIHFGEGDNKIHITVGLILALLFSLVIAKFILKWTRKLVTRKLDLADKNKFISIFRFISHITYIIVFFFILSQSGINITPFLAASAALLVGLGLALQDLFQDVIGGVFIILDKSLLVGDVIEVEGKVGKVIEIKLRTTRAITRDDKIIIIPNHILIRNSIYNFTQNGNTTRESIAIGVAYGSDTKKVEELLLSCASSHSSVLKRPKAFVTFDDFGDSALIFNLNIFVNESFNSPRIKSEIRFKIDQIFKENNITIPFPQRDVHLYQTNQKS
ncbi:MAG: small-conductance mechanosensitive channel [Flavobacteriaceae bacterium]|jgi:small-conductance mechanosensitive channel